MAVTIRDVAEKLGLSIATVSRALDGYPDISQKTQARVQRTAQEMGYTPNRAARQLRRKKADAIGYILPADTPRFTDTFYSEFLVGLGDETALHPFDLLISIAPPGHQAEQQIYENWVQSHKVDGFVINRIRRNDWRCRYLVEQNIPLATLEYGGEDLDYPHIDVDNVGGMIALVASLAQRGFKKLVYIGGPEELVIESQRFEGFCRGLEQSGLPFYPALVLPGDLSSEMAYQSFKELRWWPDPPDAIVCINDQTAIGVLHAARERGINVGTEVAITGFDGVQAAAYTDPPLTTLEMPVYEIARQLVQMLAAEITEEPGYERHLVVRPKLLERGSSRGPQSSRFLQAKSLSE
jgi:LacI family transcriptional regulator